MNVWWAVVHRYNGRVGCYAGRPTIFETRKQAREWMRPRTGFKLLRVTLVLPLAPVPEKRRCRYCEEVLHHD